VTEPSSIGSSDGKGSMDGMDVIERMTLGQLPRIWMVALIGFISILFTIVWLSTYLFLEDFFWHNDIVSNNRWIVPIGVLAFSLIVGLTIKYLNPPTLIRGGTKESITGGEVISYRRFPGTLISSFSSLLSGVSVGPEGPLGFLVEEIAGWFNTKLNIPEESMHGLKIAALASAYNGVVGSPIFTAVLATELQERNKDSLWFLGWNLLAGVIGFFVFILLGFSPLLASIVFPGLQSMEVIYIVYALILGVVGALLASFIALSFEFFSRLMAKFGDKVGLRALTAGAVTAIMVYFLLELLFSGETQIHEIILDPGSYGIGMLLLFMLLKILLLSLALKSGFLGGAIFPTLFSCTMLALALSVVFPSLPLIILVLCIEGVTISLILGGPLTAILLVVVVGALGSGGLEMYLIALIVVSIVVSMVTGAIFKRQMAGRANRKGKVALSRSQRPIETQRSIALNISCFKSSMREVEQILHPHRVPCPELVLDLQ
jgi:H+/Cl- antiporter ClcA